MKRTKCLINNLTPIFSLPFMIIYISECYNLDVLVQIIYGEPTQKFSAIVVVFFVKHNSSILC